MISNTRLTKVRHHPCRNPSPKISQPASPQGIEPDLTERALEVAGKIKNLDSGKLAVEQFAERQNATAPFEHRNDDLIDVEIACGIRDRRRARKQQLLRNANVGIRRARIEADDLNIRIGLLEYLAD